jgi:hypothetical protein
VYLRCPPSLESLQRRLSTSFLRDINEKNGCTDIPHFFKTTLKFSLSWLLVRSKYRASHPTIVPWGRKDEGVISSKSSTTISDAMWFQDVANAEFGQQKGSAQLDH